jgi:hypothetical protein
MSPNVAEVRVAYLVVIDDNGDTLKVVTTLDQALAGEIGGNVYEVPFVRGDDRAPVRRDGS